MFEELDTKKGYISKCNERYKFLFYDTGYCIKYTELSQKFLDGIQNIKYEIIPKIEQDEYKLSTYEEKFNIQAVILSALIVVLIGFISGILMPFLMFLYRDPPPTRDVQLTILGVSLLPYIGLVLYLITVISRTWY